MADSTATLEPRLKRQLGLRDLILYGIILIMPIAPVPLYGLAQQMSNGHAVTTILLAMVAMILTAVSYGRMASVFPAAGSAYTYVGRGLNAHLGFLAGWAMILDYLLVPLVCTIYGALTLHRIAPSIPYIAWAALLTALITITNLCGIRTTATANLVMMIVMSVVILAFVVLATLWLFHRQGWSGLLSSQPFYDRATFHWKSILTATSLAALTYGGFDGVSTLSEEVENPRRNVLIATVFVCFFTGIFGGLQVYLAQRVAPGMSGLTNVETAFMDISRVVGGPILFQAMAAILIVANVGSGLTGMAGISRLLYGMGRDGVLPRQVFGHLDAKRSIPSYNIALVGAFVFLGTVFLNYENVAELINFGAFLAFMGVNAAVIRQFYFLRSREQRNLLTDVLLPACGLLFCLTIWISLPSQAKLLGAAWFAAGLLWTGFQTHGFRVPPRMVNFEEG